jgi:hypothetical protein
VSHLHARQGCNERPERYGPDEQGWYLRRCRDCNVEWWEKEGGTP